MAKKNTTGWLWKLATGGLLLILIFLLLFRGCESVDSDAKGWFANLIDQLKGNDDVPGDDDQDGNETSGWSSGDILYTGDVAGTLDHSLLGNDITLDLEGDNPMDDGCELGLRLATSWNYVDPATCSPAGVSPEGLKWEVYDSVGIQYTRVDNGPQSNTMDVVPMTWDGSTDWRIEFDRTQVLPGCDITYSVQTTIFVNGC